jgi:AraC family transcriptional regulator of adaptative response/methylated-DNA-[protein]-cysteine methyltransferase
MTELGNYAREALEPHLESSDARLVPRSDYARVAKAIEFLVEHRQEAPTLTEVAAHVGLSPFHFQRLFRRWVGVSPKRFLQARELLDAKALLARKHSVLAASLDAGLSGPGRLHDLFLTFEAMTPGEFKAKDFEIAYGVHETPLGKAVFAATKRGLCGLEFVERDTEALERLRARWPNARFVARPKLTKRFADELSRRLRGDLKRPLALVVKGTPLQLKVWQALLRIPPGSVTTYGAIAKALGSPKATRAVGSAVGANPICVLIPCHRVIQSSGALGGYHWGEGRKRALLASEAARLPERDETGQ